MLEFLFLLLPVAAASGWFIGRKSNQHHISTRKQKFSGNYYAGLNYLLNEQPDKAVDAFLKILTLDDEMIEIHLLLGSLFRRRGEVDRAIRIHQGLLARPTLIATQKAILLLELGKDYYHAGMYDRAEDHFLRLIDAREQLEVSFDYLLNIYQQERDWEKAIATAEKIKHILHKNMNLHISHYYCELAELAMKNRNLSQVMKLLKQAIRMHKNCVRASLLYGNLCKNQGKYARAIKFYKDVQRQDPKYLALTVAPLVECYEKLGNKNGVVEYLIGCFDRQVLDMEKIEYGNQHAIYAVLQFIDLLKEKESIEKAIGYLTEYLNKYPSLQGLYKVVELHLQKDVNTKRRDLLAINELVKALLAKESRYKCGACGFPSNTLQWQCPGCRRWWG